MASSAALAQAGVDRSRAYVTNAVKHFKFKPQMTARGGKRRLHQNPDRAEIDICKWWLGLEQRFIQPTLTLAVGGTLGITAGFNAMDGD